MTILKLLEEYAKLHEDNPSIGYTESGREYIASARQFYTDVKKAENYFRKGANGEKKRIGIVGENSYSYLVILFGIICSENIAVPINQTYADEMLCQFFKKTCLAEAICDEAYAGSLLEMDTGIKIYSMEDCFAEIMKEDEKPYIDSDAKSSDIILMLLSSGTSGVSKVVQLTNENLSTFPMRVQEYDRGKAKKSLLLLPFYHISGIIPLLEDMMLGNLIYLSNAKYLIRDLEQYDIEKLILVPAMLKKVLGQCEKNEAFKNHCSNIKEALCLGAPMDDALIEKMKANSIEPKTYYGMTETTGTVSGEGKYKFGACGKISPFCQVKIEEGEILVKGPNVMVGYFNDEEETSKVLKNGWIHTGDLGEIDEEGYLFVRGRKKNIIILSNGENVCPEELENRLYMCQYIEECKVFGDEEVKAEIFCGKHKNMDEIKQNVKDYVRSMNRTLPPSHKIKDIVFNDNPLKKNSMGKISRI